MRLRDQEVRWETHLSGSAGCRLHTWRNHHSDPGWHDRDGFRLPVLLSVLEKPTDPRDLSLQEWDQIRDMSTSGIALRAIASLL